MATSQPSPICTIGDRFVHVVAFDETSRTFTVRFSGDDDTIETFDQIVANVGYRPDTSLTRELQIHSCYATEGPIKLAATLLGESSADCLQQQCGAADTLTTPEPDFYVLGSKSYGRESNFLYRVGLDQIRVLFAAISGRDDLDLYESVKNLV